MTWGKSLIIFLGLMQLSHVAHARDIESFTDSQGTLHITNTGPKQPESPANPPSPAAPLRPGSLPGKAPIALPAREPAPKAQAPAPKPEPQPQFTIQRLKPRLPSPRRLRPYRFRLIPNPVPGSPIQKAQAGSCRWPTGPGKSRGREQTAETPRPSPAGILVSTSAGNASSDGKMSCAETARG